MTDQSNASMFCLTQSQLLLWTGQQFNPQLPLYNMALAFDISGELNELHFKLAFQALINQSDAMRTVFDIEDGEPVQKILPVLNYETKVYDWADGSKTKEKINSYLKKRSQQNFNLAICCFDSILIKLNQERYIWFFNQHHLITDAWAVTVLYQAMAELYNKSLNDSISAFKSLPLFQNYLKIEQGSATKQNQKALNYWKEKITALPVIPMFFGNNTTEIFARSQRIKLDLGLERSEQLRNLTFEPDLRQWTQHLSLFNIFSTILFVFLYRISGQQKLAIGTPAHNRSTPDFKSTPGLFIEIFPLISEIKKEDSFGSLIQRVKNETQLFLKHAQPGTSSPDLNRGFNVVLNYINAAFSDFNGYPMQSQWIHPDYADPGHHLRLQVHDFDASGSIQLYFDLNESIFSEKLIHLVPEYFLQLLDAFISDRSQPIDQPGLLSKQALENAINIFSDTEKTEFDFHSVISLFERQTDLNPEAIAIQYKNQTFSFDSINSNANQLARYLIDLEIKQGDRVALFLSRSPNLIISILACLKAGIAYVPIPTNYPIGKVESIIKDAEVNLLISSYSLLNKINTAHAPSLDISAIKPTIQNLPTENLSLEYTADSIAYIMYTSGSTGESKGVIISNGALSNYIQWAAEKYIKTDRPNIPLFTSIGFDLTVTSLFLPLVTGGVSIIYEEQMEGPDLALLQVIKENKSDFIKLTPSHLNLIKDQELQNSQIKTMVVGGEDFKTELAKKITLNFGEIDIYNEYGPTEATVGCIVQLYKLEKNKQISVPIGRPLPYVQAFILDSYLNSVPPGIAGELYLAGAGLAEGYWNRPKLNDEKFILNPFDSSSKLYRTGDLVRLNDNNEFEFLGRLDQQVKIGGRRIELGEIEAALNTYPDIHTCVVDLRERKQQAQEVANCNSCGLPSNYPGTEFDEEGVCHLCSSFELYQQKVQEYFKTPDDLKTLINSVPKASDREYDCLMLFSGGKDSTYALGQLIELGFNVLTFTLDNGYISEQAKANIRRVTKELGVEHVFGETPAMNQIFVDSLQRHCNVCDGCFKTIYTLSIKLALEKNIPFIITGLSRGQLFETRLTEELFTGNKNSIEDIDQIILKARKDYHRVDDAVKQLMDVSIFDDDEVFEKVRFVDFYRYTDVSLDEMYEYLDNRLPWSRPTDTGRSTNCLINQTGIFIHKKEKGYSNYAFPYSWDVRIGHKERNASLEEINEELDEKEVFRILDEIGYSDAEQSALSEKHLIAYYVSQVDIPEMDLSLYLSSLIPDYMIPVQFIRVDKMPITENGKIDHQALPKPDAIRPMLSIGYIAPSTDIELLLAEIWSDVLNIEQIGIHDKFLHLGGHSLTAIRLTARINEALNLDLPLDLIFRKPTISTFAEHIRETIERLMAEMDETQTES